MGFFSYIEEKKKIAEFISQYDESENTKEWLLFQAISGMSEKGRKENDF